MVVNYNHAYEFAHVYEIAPTNQLALKFEKSQFFFATKLLHHGAMEFNHYKKSCLLQLDL
jgi:hypothetical protein